MRDAASLSCLKSRLLFACRQAYHPAWPEPEAFPKVHWTSAPETVTDPAPDPGHHIDAALVGEVAEAVLVAFRGTLPPFRPTDEIAPSLVLGDWLNNLRFWQDHIEPFPGRVHVGFARSIGKLWGKAGEGRLADKIPELLARAPGKPLLFTGHSKGGALAVLAAWLARDLGHRIQVFTIGAPRAGDSHWRDAFNAESRIKCWRYESTLDPVPYLPFDARTPPWLRIILGRFLDGMSLDYEPVGWRIPASSSSEESRVAAQRWGEDVGRVALHPDQYLSLIADRHLIDPGRGYDDLVCETGCAPGHWTPG